jgi:hypothetical protein
MALKSRAARWVVGIGVAVVVRAIGAVIAFQFAVHKAKDKILSMHHHSFPAAR